MRIFLDVGANVGQTVAGVLRYEPRFDSIVCFEPAPECWPALQSIVDDRIRVCRFGLWNKTCDRTLLEPGSKGASLWRKLNLRSSSPIERTCQFVRASEWFRDNLLTTDQVWMKLNCEGAECDILDDLLDSGQFTKVFRLAIMFDVHKIAGMAHRRLQTLDRLAPYEFPRVAIAQDVMEGARHPERIASWLRKVEP